MDSVKKYPLFRLLQKQSKELDAEGFIGTILMDLSEVYDCLCHDLLMVKLVPYGPLTVNGQKIDVEFLKGQNYVQFSFAILKMIILYTHANLSRN